MTVKKKAAPTQIMLEKLAEINWDFESKSSKGDITSLHPYPARFIPSIPRAILEATKYNYSTIKVLDPFAGCGTTLSEASLSGASAVGIDVNGLASFLQTAYTTKYSNKDLDIFLTLVRTIEENLVKTKLPSGCPKIPNLNHWFDNDSIHIIDYAIKTINRERASKMAKVLGLLSISRILVKLSRQKSDTQYVAIDKKLTYEQKTEIIIESFKTVHAAFESNVQSLNGNVLCIHGDSRKEETYSEVEQVNLVITSPPYPNAYEYWLYHKYRMYWLGMDPIYSRANEIGVRPHYSGTGKKDEWDFYKDVQSVLTNIDRVTTKDALQFWIVGDSIIKGKEIDNARIVVTAAKELGWKNIVTINRKIDRKRSSFQGIGNKELEKIIVLSR